MRILVLSNDLEAEEELSWIQPTLATKVDEIVPMELRELLIEARSTNHIEILDVRPKYMNAVVWVVKFKVYANTTEEYIFYLHDFDTEGILCL